MKYVTLSSGQSFPLLDLGLALGNFQMKSFVHLSIKQSKLAATILIAWGTARPSISMKEP